MNTIKVENFGEIISELTGRESPLKWNLIFPRFMLHIVDQRFVYYVEENPDDGRIFFGVHVQIPKSPDKYMYIGKFEYSQDLEGIGTIETSDAGEEWLHRKTDIFGLTMEIEDFVFYVLFATLTYITLKSEERKVTNKGKSSHKAKYSREHRLSTSNNKIYLLDDIIAYASEEYVPESGHFEYTCPCWEVRGHYRHYKNGNVIFIKSYKKGKEKDKAEPISHEYRLERGQK